MFRPAHYLRPRVWTVALLLLATRSAPGYAQTVWFEDDDFLEAGSDIFQVVRSFDFAERPVDGEGAGTYDDTPMYWTQLSGDGLPRYSRGQFDDDVGRTAPPSFRFDLQGGNILYEYQHNDLTVLPDADYLVIGYVRAAGLEHARAFLQAYLVDRLGARIPGSDRISELIAPRGTGVADEPWQRVHVALVGSYPDAYAVRLRLWVLQDHNWRRPPTNAVDPIIRQDVRGTVWFDDITLYRLPRARLSFSEPGNIVLAGEAADFLLDVHNSTSQSLYMEIRVVDEAGAPRSRVEIELPGHQSAPFSTPMPELEPGLYEAQLRLKDGNRLVIYRVITFGVLPRLPATHDAFADFGVDIGRWRSGQPEEVLALIEALRPGALKIGMPLIDSFDADIKEHYIDQIRDIARGVIDLGVRTTGVLLLPNDRVKPGTGRTLRALLVDPETGGEWLESIMAPAGGLLMSWQLGDELIETASGQVWSAAELAELRRELHQYVTAPQLVVPYSAFDPRVAGAAAQDRLGAPTDARTAAGRPEVVSIHVPDYLPTSSLVRQLAFLQDRPGRPAEQVPADATTRFPPVRRWLRIDTERKSVPRHERIADTARRVVLAHALRPDRTYVPAPFDRSQFGGGAAAWQPQAEFIPLRTLFHFLTGKEIAAAAPLLDQDAILLIFEDPDASCAVLWSWRNRDPLDPLELYLGDHPILTELSGARRPLPVRHGRAQVPVGRMPVIVDNIDLPLALLATSMKIAPAFIQLHEPEPHPTLQLQNMYGHELAGTIDFELPPNWRVHPAHTAFILQPGQRLEQPLRLALPPRQIASTMPIRARLDLNAPVSRVLEFDVPMTVGLRDVRVELKTRLENEYLVVEQTLHNRSFETVSFSAYCQAPGRAQLPGAFLAVGPGDTEMQVYEFANGAELIGGILRAGIREVRPGVRTLDQILQVSP